MKKLTLFITILALSVSLSAQTKRNDGPKALIAYVSNHMMGIESDSGTERMDDGSYMNYVYIGIPLDNSLSDVSNVIVSAVRRFSDLRVIESWIQVEKGLYRCLVEAANELVFVYYSESNNVVGFVYKR